MPPYPQSCKTFLLIAGRVKRSRPITLVSCRSGFLPADFEFHAGSIMLIEPKRLDSSQERILKSCLRQIRLWRDLNQQSIFISYRYLKWKSIYDQVIIPYTKKQRTLSKKTFIFSFISYFFNLFFLVISVSLCAAIYYPEVVIPARQSD